MLRRLCVRFGAAALGALAVAVAPAEAGIISNVGAIPNPFSPNEDGIFDSTAVHYTLADSAAVIVSVADSTLAELLTLWSGWGAPGEYSHWWDGSVDGTPVEDGAYYFLIEAVPHVGGMEEADFRFLADTESPRVSFLSAAPSRFSPDGDGVGDSLFVDAVVELSGPHDHVLLTVLDTADSLVRSLHAATGADSVSECWDGTDDAGELVSDGLYYVRLSAWDDAGNSADAGALVDVDTAPPALGVDYPDPDLGEIRVNDAVATIAGWAYDRAGVTAVEYTDDGENWYEISVGRADTVAWEFELACASCVPDSLDEAVAISVRARDGTPTADGGGHVNTETSAFPILAFDVVFDVAPPIHDTTHVTDADAIYSAGQKISITTSWDASGYEVTADFSLVDSEFDSSAVVVHNPSAGLYTVSYTTSTNNTFVPVYDAVVPITATDYFGRSVVDSSVTVTVLPAEAGPTGLSLDRNAFDPTESEVLNISFGPGAGDVVVRVFSLAGALVRTIESDGSTTVTWDGRNDSGDYVASGVYFLRIESETGDATRKVAVVK